MKSKYIFGILIVLMAACTNGEKEELTKEVQQLKNEKTMIEQVAHEKDSVLNSFVQSINEIEENLAVIKEKERIISSRGSSVENRKQLPEQILEDINQIHGLLLENKQKVVDLSRKIRKSNLKITELEKLIELFTTRLSERDREITELRERLTVTDGALRNLFNEYNARLRELEEREDKLHTAYYAYGTMKELKLQNVIDKQGSFIGIGGTAQVKQDFNKGYFTKIDTRNVHSIELYSKKAKLLTSHPSDSYKFTGEGKVETIEITDAESFWSASKYLVIVVD